MVSVVLDTSMGNVDFLRPLDNLFPHSAESLFQIQSDNHASYTFTPGYLFPEGPGPHSVMHANATGTINMHGSRDEEKTKDFWSFNDPWGTKSQHISCHEIQGFPNFYNPEPVLDVDLLSAYQAALYTPWYYGNNYHVSVSMDSFTYRKRYFNRPSFGENDGSEVEYTSYQATKSGGIVTFKCHGRSRSHVSGFKQPPTWGPWKDTDDRTFQFELMTGFYDTLMSAFRRIDMNFLEAEVAVQVARCAWHNSQLDLTHCIADAAEQTELIDMNNIENAMSAADISGLLPISDVVKLARNYDDPMQWVKSGTSLYLYYKYAVLPTVSDVRTAIEMKKGTIKSAFSGLVTQSFRSRGNDSFDDGCVSTYGATVVIQPSARSDCLAKAYNALDRLGLALTPSNLWDTVPYSFVVDWFANTNDILDSISMYCHPWRFSVQNIATYTKTTKVVHVDDDVFSGHYTASDYVRNNSHLFPPLRLQKRDLWRSHKLEGAALIISRFMD